MKAHGDTTAERLQWIARHDPLPAIRVRSLWLLDELPGAVGVEVARAVLEDQSPDVRLVAAVVLGEEGRDQALTLLGERSASLEERARAALALFDRHPARREAVSPALRAIRLEAQAADLEAPLERRLEAAHRALVAELDAPRVGQLALVDVDGMDGALSVAEEAGTVSLVDE